MNKTIDQSPFKMTQKIAAERIAGVLAIVEGLPGAGAVAAGNHFSLEALKKRFGWLLNDHHGDGRLAINCKAPKDVAQQLANHAPDRFHIPNYVGHLGWVGLWIDTPQIDWTEVKAVLVGAYRLTAPRKLIAELDAKHNA
jgi:hypothetical protein